MTEQEEKEYLKGIILKLMVKFSKIDIPEVLSEELNNIINKEVNHIHNIVIEDLSDDDFIKKLYNIDWFKFFDKINEEMVIQQIKLPKI
jgi:hypothetical protein